MPSSPSNHGWGFSFMALLTWGFILGFFLVFSAACLHFNTSTKSLSFDRINSKVSPSVKMYDGCLLLGFLFVSALRLWGTGIKSSNFTLVSVSSSTAQKNWKDKHLITSMDWIILMFSRRIGRVITRPIRLERMDNVLTYAAWQKVIKWTKYSFKSLHKLYLQVIQVI